MPYKCKVGPSDNKDYPWMAVIYLETLEGVVEVTTVGVEHSEVAAISWGGDAIEALKAGQPTPPDAYERERRQCR